MKKRNTLRLRKALALFSVVVITFTHGMPAYAGVAESVATEETSEQIEEVQEPEVQPDATEESVAETPAPVAPVEPSQPEVVDTTQVSQLLTQVNQIIANESSYTPASFAAAKPQLLAAQASAQALLANPQATTAEVTQVVEQLQASFAGLILKSDKTALNQLIQASGSYQAATYTAATFAVFQTALTQAKTVAENENATEAEVAQALTALQQAIAQLKKQNKLSRLQNQNQRNRKNQLPRSRQNLRKRNRKKQRQRNNQKQHLIKVQFKKVQPVKLFL